MDVGVIYALDADGAVDQDPDLARWCIDDRNNRRPILRGRPGRDAVDKTRSGCRRSSSPAQAGARHGPDGAGDEFR